MEMSLEALKEENAAGTVEAPEVTAPPEVETELEAGTDDAPKTEEPAEATEAEGGKTELEAWQATDEQASDDGGQFTGSDIAAAKKKLRAKLEREHNTELQELRAEIQALKRPASQPQAKPEAQAIPQLSEYDYDEARHQAAVSDWLSGQVDARVRSVQESSVQTAREAQARQTLDRSVDDHYQRAATLAKDAGIEPDVYKTADLHVRQTIDSVFPGQGDVFTDQFISRLGEGSEKVMYYLGRNPTALGELRQRISDDPSGLSASIYLGELKGKKVAAPKKQSSTAPAPANRAVGDTSAAATGDAKALKKAYDDAHKKHNGQKALDVKFSAKRAGFDTSNW